MAGEFDRLNMLIGSDALSRLAQAYVVLFGVGGVGGFTAETLARSGVGHVTLIDGDRVAMSNINRQIVALHSTLGEYKVEAARRRMLDINPEMRVDALARMFMPGDAAPFGADVDYVIDAVDMVAAKLALAELCIGMDVPLISCMGTGNKFDPTRLEVADIYSTDVCPLCRVMRRELRKRGVSALKVVYSREQPTPPRVEPDAHSDGTSDESRARRATPGSTMFVPPVAGIMLAREAVLHIIGAQRSAI